MIPIKRRTQVKNKRNYVKTALISAMCLIMVLCGVRFEAGSPDNPIAEAEAASAMFTSAQDILYDEDILSDMDNANINAGKSEEETQADSDEDTQEEDKDSGSESQKKDKESSQKKQGEENPEDSSSQGKVLDDGELWDSSSFDFSKGEFDVSQILDINEHIPDDGEEGGQLPSLDPGQNEGNDEEAQLDQYFKTSIIEGDVLDEQDYTFTITHLKPELTVSGISITLNGNEQTYSGQTTGFELKLAEGANTILVQAVYFDGTNYITASKAYTVYYAEGDKVIIITDLTNRTTPEESIDFFAYGIKGTERLAASVKLNGRELVGRNDRFSAKLEAGENRLTISAGGRADRVSETYIVIYKEDAFKITTTISDTVITNETNQLDNQREEVTYYGDSEEYKFKLSLHKETGKEKIRYVKLGINPSETIKAGGDGYYHISLSQRSSKYLFIGYTNADGENKIYKYLIRFKRNPEATPVEKQPTIYAQIELDDTTYNLENGMLFKNPDIITNITALSWDNEQLYYNHFDVRINGMKIHQHVSQTDAWFGYNTYLSKEGENTITVTVTDNDGYTATKTWKVYYEKGNIKVKISVEATTVGLGYLVPPTYVEVPGGTALTDILRQVLDGCGYSYNDTGGTYLATIEKPGICNGFYIDPELMELIIADDMDTTGSGYDPQPSSPDSLGEFDFYRWSGWMYSYNGKYPGYGINVCKPQDGAVIRFRFTLALGKDIGGFSASMGGAYGETNRNYYKEW